MKRIFIMDGNGIQEYVPVGFQNKTQVDDSTTINEEKVEEYKLLTIVDLIKKFQVTRSTIYAWIEKGLLKKIPLGGRVLFHSEDIKELIEKMRNVSS
nr:helix-turn-helix domain-containing protein [uncultured Allomuricauda sp.]